MQGHGTWLPVNEPLMNVTKDRAARDVAVGIPSPLFYDPDGQIVSPLKETE